jgi:hypothetical protein
MARLQGSPNLAKNLTIKSLPNLLLRIGADEAPRMLCTFLGTVTGTEIKTTTLGESVRFIGTFEAIDLSTGETARGSSMYLPGYAETVVADAFTQATGRPIQFALNVGLRYRQIANKDGCEYTVHEIGGITEHDPLAALKQAFGIRGIATRRPDMALEAPKAGDAPDAGDAGDAPDTADAGGVADAGGAPEAGHDAEVPEAPAKGKRRAVTGR